MYPVRKLYSNSKDKTSMELRKKKWMVNTCCKRYVLILQLLFRHVMRWMLHETWGHVVVEIFLSLIDGWVIFIYVFSMLHLFIFYVAVYTFGSPAVQALATPKTLSEYVYINFIKWVKPKFISFTYPFVMENLLIISFAHQKRNFHKRFSLLPNTPFRDLHKAWCYQ